MELSLDKNNDTVIMPQPNSEKQGLKPIDKENSQTNGPDNNV